MDDKFISWKSTQDLTSWKFAFKLKCRNAAKVGLRNLLTLDEYLFKAYEAGLISADQIGIKGFHLSRINDTGDYTVESCRFLPYYENHAEKDKKSISNKLLGNTHALGSKGQPGNTHSQGTKHWKTKLTEDIVKEIFLSNNIVELICLEYNVSKSIVDKIRSRVTWKHVTKELIRN